MIVDQFFIVVRRIRVKNAFFPPGPQRKECQDCPLGEECQDGPQREECQDGPQREEYQDCPLGEGCQNGPLGKNQNVFQEEGVVPRCLVVKHFWVESQQVLSHGVESA